MGWKENEAERMQKLRDKKALKEANKKFAELLKKIKMGIIK